MRGKTPRRDTIHYMKGLRRFLQGLGERVANGETSGSGQEEVYLLREMEKELHAVQDAVIDRWRQDGTTDADIAKLLGVSRQAVSKRWPGHGKYVGAAGRFRRRDTPADRPVEEVGDGET